MLERRKAPASAGAFLSITRILGSAPALAARKHKGLAADIRGAINFSPETDEVVDCGDGRYQGSEVDGCDGDPLDRNDEEAELPLVPLMGQDGGDYGDDLGDRFQLAQVAGLDGEALRGSD